VYLAGYNYTGYTGPGGAFELDNVPAGTYSLVVTVGGAIKVTQSVTVATSVVNLNTVSY
jgi:hypothetical protein